MKHQLSPEELTKRKRINKRVLIALGIFFAFFIIVSVTSKPVKHKSVQTKPIFSIDYGNGSDASSWVENPATLKIFLIVKNTGKVVGTPSCYIEASDESGTYKGYRTYVDDKQLKPGDDWAFYATLTITNQGAAYANRISFNCDQP